MRVLQVLACDDLGGTELMVSTLVERSDPELVSFDVAFLAPRGPVSTRLSSAGIRVHSLGGAGLRVAVRRLARILRREHFDVVNAYGFKAALIARLLTRALSSRSTFVCGVRGLHVTEVVDLSSPKARLASLIERALSPLVDLYDVNSPGAVDFLVGLGIDRSRVRYIPNGLDLKRWPVHPRPDGTAQIVCVARFVSRKRHEDLMHALRLLREAGVSFTAVLAGEGPTLGATQSLAGELGLEDFVAFPGKLENAAVAVLMREASVFCLPSAWEGMPGAVMEAMASGVVVVGTDVNGTAELVISGETGLLVPSGHPAQLAEALRGVLADPAYAAILAAAGRRRIEDCFSLEAMISAKEKLYVTAARSN